MHLGPAKSCASDTIASSQPGSAVDSCVHVEHKLEEVEKQKYHGYLAHFIMANRINELSLIGTTERYFAFGRWYLMD
jgi:hypothetical protein